MTELARGYYPPWSDSVVIPMSQVQDILLWLFVPYLAIWLVFVVGSSLQCFRSAAGQRLLDQRDGFAVRASRTDFDWCDPGRSDDDCATPVGGAVAPPLRALCRVDSAQAGLLGAHVSAHWSPQVRSAPSIINFR